MPALAADPRVSAVNAVAIVASGWWRRNGTGTSCAVEMTSRSGRLPPVNRGRRVRRSHKQIRNGRPPPPDRRS
jgi:hypothetical protein